MRSSANRMKKSQRISLKNLRYKLDTDSDTDLVNKERPIN